jgi:CubicO group peptidase (beta-lactamase class C family)
MRTPKIVAIGALLAGSLSFFDFGLGACAAGKPAAATPSPLVGLWEARLRFGPDVRGPLQLTQDSTGWRAEIAGRAAKVTVAGGVLRAQLPDDAGAFVGRLAADRGSVRGHWIQPPTVANGTRYASPVVLTRSAVDRNSLRGAVVPLDDAMTLYLVVRARADGSLGVFLRNPERNVGHFVNLDHLEQHGEEVTLFGRDPKGPTVHGRFRDGLLSITIPPLGGTYDFRRVAPEDASDFYPRGRPTVPYAYVSPPLREDGWATATPEDVGLSRAALGRFMQMIVDTPMDSIHAPEIHGVLVARHGKLVLEEYFHGEHRDKPHDTRSASKSLASTLIGAAVQARLPIAATTPVYATFDGAGAVQPDPHKRALTLEQLMTMSSGLDCDDRDPQSAGNEDRLWDDRPADFYRYTLDLKSVRAPGERAVYCSASANLAGGVLAKATGRPLMDLFAELLAEPLHIDHYWLNLMPSGDAYMGGGVRMLPRDFMKLGQLFLDGGKWHGRRIVGDDWVRRATSPLHELQKLRYGYLWWNIEYPYRGHNVRAFFAAGNGGQLVMVLPELDLVVCVWGGNYSDPVFYDTQQKYVPQYLLPAVDAP